MGLNLLIPLDYFYDSKTGASKKEYLIQKEQKELTRKELEAEYEQILNQIDIYKEHNMMLKDNMKIYDELIEIADAKVKAGYVSGYDLDILKNTQKSNELSMMINDIDIKRQWADIYFKMMR
jgi:Mg2+/Co2+ transporter CorC